MEVLSKALSIAAGVATGWGSRELLTFYTNAEGRYYGDVLVNVVTTAFGSTEFAAFIKEATPILSVPIIFLVTRIPVEKLLFVMFGTKDKKKLMQENPELVLNEADDRMMHDVPREALLVANDFGVKGDPERSKVKGRKGEEQFTNGSRNPQPGDTMFKSPPHVHVKGRHFPISRRQR